MKLNCKAWPSEQKVSYFPHIQFGLDNATSATDSIIESFNRLIHQEWAEDVEGDEVGEGKVGAADEVGVVVRFRGAESAVRFWRIHHDVLPRFARCWAEQDHHSLREVDLRRRQRDEDF